MVVYYAWFIEKICATVSEPVGFTVASFDVAPQVTKVMESNPEVVGVAGFGVHAALFTRNLEGKVLKVVLLVLNCLQTQ